MTKRSRVRQHHLTSGTTDEIAIAAHFVADPENANRMTQRTNLFPNWLTGRPSLAPRSGERRPGFEVV